MKEPLKQEDVMTTTINAKLYRGNEGKRKAFMDLLKRALSLKKPSKLFITSMEDMLWLTEDRSYTEALSLLLFQVIRVGHKMVFIHSFDRTQSNLLFMMEYWTPLFLTGAVESYYFDRYSTNIPRPTIFILENDSCIFSYTYEDNMPNSIYYLYMEPDIVSAYKNVFMSIIKNSHSLFTTFDALPQTFYDISSGLFEKPGFTYAFLHKMYAVAMPPNLYEKILSRVNISKSEQKQRLSLYKSKYKAFLNSIKKHKFSIVIYSNMVEDLHFHNKVPYWGADFFENKDVEVEPDELLEHLNYLHQLSEEYSNFQVLAVKSDTTLHKVPLFSYLLKEDHYAIAFYQKSPHHNTNLIKSSDFFVIKSYELYHKNILEALVYESCSIDCILSVLRDIVCNSEAARYSIFDELLTKRESIIALLLLEGKTVIQIAEEIIISRNTVKSHIKNIYRKLDVATKFEFINRYSMDK